MESMHLIDKYSEQIIQTEYYKNIIKNLSSCLYDFHIIICGRYEYNLIIDAIINYLFKKINYNIISYTVGKHIIKIKHGINYIVINLYGNSLDKHIITKIIKSYVKNSTLELVNNTTKFKYVIINCLDYIIHSTQILLSKIMDEYSDKHKFLIFNNELSSMHQQLQSRCLIYRLEKPSNQHMLEIGSYILQLEKKTIDLDAILNKSNSINNLIWNIELEIKNIKYIDKTKHIITKIVNILIHKDSLNLLNDLQQLYYKLYTSNIKTEKILFDIMYNIIEINSNNIDFCKQIINITSKYSKLLTQCTRHILYVQGYFFDIIKLIKINNFY